MKNPVHFLLLVFFLISCHAAKKSYHSGDFEAAIEKSVNKLKRDPTDEEARIYLEAAYDKLYYQTLDRVTFLKKEGRPENVMPVYDEYSKLKLYESMIRPLMPVYLESKKREARFHFISDDDFIVAKQQAAEYLYARSVQLLNTDRRLEARQAYELLEDLQCIYPTYKDSDRLMQEALHQGTNKVNLQMVNHSGAPLFSELENQMTTLAVGDLNTLWVQFSNTKNADVIYDYQVIMEIRQLMVTPDLQLTPVVYTDKKTVQDGFEYELDSKGNVKKDSLGNDIKKPKYKTISCIVTEFIQQKSVTLGGTIDFRDARQNLLYSYPLTVFHVFEHRWATANGDLNALSRESSAKVKVGPAPYPAEINMLLLASDELKAKVRMVVNDHRGLLLQ